jgi:hypothetical protein
MPGAGFVIARAIFQRGMEARAMFQQTVDELRPIVVQNFNIAVDQAIAAGMATARAKAAATSPPAVSSGATAISILRRRGLLPGDSTGDVLP